VWLTRVLILGLVAYPTLAVAAGPTVTIDSPTAGAVVGDSVAVSGTLQSTYTLSAVQAQLQGGAGSYFHVA
jgi:Bacterial Ig domain